MIVNIDKDLCTGCQECVKVCPVSAITGEPHKPQEIAVSYTHLYYLL